MRDSGEALTCQVFVGDNCMQLPEKEERIYSESSPGSMLCTCYISKRPSGKCWLFKPEISHFHMGAGKNAGDIDEGSVN